MVGNIQTSSEGLKGQLGEVKAKLELETNPIEKAKLLAQHDQLTSNLAQNNIRMQNLNHLIKENKAESKKVSDNRQKVEDGKREAENIANKGYSKCIAPICKYNLASPSMKLSLDRTNQIRKNYANSGKKLGDLRTVGYGDIYDNKGNVLESIFAHSGGGLPNKNGVIEPSLPGSIGTSLEQGITNPLFKHYRPNEPEVKMMEYVAKKYANQEVNISIFTDRKTCNECVGMFKNQVNFYGKSTEHFNVNITSGPFGVKEPIPIR